MSVQAPTSLFTIEDVREAATRLGHVVAPTPTLAVDLGGEEASVVLKLESLQRGGSFKFRGAYNKISQLREEQRRRGVVTYSSGNHGRAVAIAAGLAGSRAIVFLPKDGVPSKAEAVAAAGADIILYDRLTEDRAALATEFAERHDMPLVPPFEDTMVMAGQGTIALELASQCDDGIDVLLVPVGGGGLISGNAVAAAGLFPGVRVIGVEADRANAGQLSLKAGERIRIPPPTTIADAMRKTTIGELPWQVIRNCVADIVTVSDDALRAAVNFAFRKFNLVIEPTSASTIAVLMTGAVAGKGKRVACIISGGNVDPRLFGEIVAEAPARAKEGDA